MRRPSASSLTVLQAEADRWNEANPVGTAVEVRQDGGGLFLTKTRSQAWVMGEHSAVVMVDGIAGGYSLNRVMPRKENAQPAEAGTPNEWKVIRIDDCDWWMARSVEEAIESAMSYYGHTWDEIMENPPTVLSAADLERIRYTLEHWECSCGAKYDSGMPDPAGDWRWNGLVWEHCHGYPVGHVAASNKISFAEQLKRRIAAGPVVELFATTEH